MPKQRSASVLTACLFFLGTVCLLLLLSRCFAAPTDTADAPPGGGRAIALMYHHLLPRSEVGRYRGNNIVTYVEDFEAQLRLLQERNCTVITPDVLEAFFYDGQPLPERAVLITLDDGYLSNAVYTAPLLRKYGMKAVVFTVTGCLNDSEAAFNPRYIQMLSAAQMRDTADVLVYASHTHDLHRFVRTGHSALTDCSSLDFCSDLESSLAFLQTVPHASLTCFSYPYGLYTEEVKRELAAQGVRLAFRASGGVITEAGDPYALPRYPVDSSVSLQGFERYLSGLTGS